ncbi:c2h2-like zinc finger protein [Anaeramoeba flamelloides]|uniref:C2h2-like zinc finger protein n=1 Tax=Anaeramoeba flamelloides TaxID=1746091 RepID=A0AAV8A578_9EUKA|nr:c2h2-like zinc finger protein [Anaeramoeba flamelloides]
MSKFKVYWLDHSFKGVKKAIRYLKEQQVRIKRFKTIRSLNADLNRKKKQPLSLITTEQFLLNQDLITFLPKQISIIVCSNRVLKNQKLKYQCGVYARIAKNPGDLYKIIYQNEQEYKKQKHKQNKKKKKKQKLKKKQKQKTKNTKTTNFLWITRKENEKVNKIIQFYETKGIKITILESTIEAIFFIRNEKVKISGIICGSHCITQKKIKKQIKKLFSKDIIVIGFSKKISKSKKIRKACFKSGANYCVQKKEPHLRLSYYLRSINQKTKDKYKKMKKKKKMEKEKEKEKKKKTEKEKETKGNKKKIIVWVDFDHKLTKLKHSIKRFELQNYIVKFFDNAKRGINFISNSTPDIKTVILSTKVILGNRLYRDLSTIKKIKRSKIVIFSTRSNQNRKIYEELQEKAPGLPITYNTDELEYRVLSQSNQYLREPIDRNIYLICLIKKTQGSQLSKTIRKFQHFKIIILLAQDSDDIFFHLKKNGARGNVKCIITDAHSVINDNLVNKCELIHRSIKIFVFDQSNNHTGNKINNQKDKCLEKGIKNYYTQISTLEHYLFLEYNIITPNPSKILFLSQQKNPNIKNKKKTRKYKKYQQQNEDIHSRLRNKKKYSILICYSIDKAKQYTRQYGESIKIVISDYLNIIKEDLFKELHQEYPIIVLPYKRSHSKNFIEKCQQFGASHVAQSNEQVLQLVKSYLGDTIQYNKQTMLSVTRPKFPPRKMSYLVQITKNSKKYLTIKKQFLHSWNGKEPTILSIVSIVINEELQAKYNDYKNAIVEKTQMDSISTLVGLGNERRRFHGTKLGCTVGIAGNLDFCNNTNCVVCSVCKNGFQLKYSQGGLFGYGLYFSASAEKSNQYTKNITNDKHKVILLVKVVCGRGFIAKKKYRKIHKAPENCDCVIYDIKGKNKNETIVYSDNAAIPRYMVFYKD